MHTDFFLAIANHKGNYFWTNCLFLKKGLRTYVRAFHRSLVFITVSFDNSWKFLALAEKKGMWLNTQKGERLIQYYLLAQFHKNFFKTKCARSPFTAQKRLIANVIFFFLWKKKVATAFWWVCKGYIFQSVEKHVFAVAHKPVNWSEKKCSV